MKPAPFTYHAPTTIEQALGLLASEPDARVLAGGQSLVPRMRLRVEKPATIIDINRVVGLDGISVDAGAVTVGALVRQQTLVTHDGVAAVHPLLREAGSYAGFHTTRHRGTVGGSIAFAAPWAELAATTTLLGATITVRSTKAQRTLAASDFFLGPNETALAADELVTEVQFPAAPAGAGFGFHEASPRYRDYATAAAAASITIADGVCSSAALVLLRAAPAPLSIDVASILVGRVVDDAAIEDVVQSFAGLDPPTDIEASGAHRRRLAVTLTRRALADAWANAQGAVA